MTEGRHNPFVSWNKPFSHHLQSFVQQPSMPLGIKLWKSKATKPLRFESATLFIPIIHWSSSGQQCRFWGRKMTHHQRVFIELEVVQLAKLFIAQNNKPCKLFGASDGKKLFRHFSCNVMWTRKFFPILEIFASTFLYPWLVC
jgi:hypothetical protein